MKCNFEPEKSTSLDDPGRLERFFTEFNRRHFQSSLPIPVLRFNTRLRSCAGRFFPGILGENEKNLIWNLYTSTIESREFRALPRIEIANYLIELDESPRLIRDTIGHEMIHYWLWYQKKPHGHTPEFYEKMRELGVPRFNSVPKNSVNRVWYECLGCRSRVSTLRRYSHKVACTECCQTHSKGEFDARFELVEVLGERAVEGEFG